MIQKLKLNGEVKKVVKRLKSAQGRLKGLISYGSWLDDARKYAERQGQEVTKLLVTDMGKIREFVDKERKELERLQKRIPAEVQKWKKYVSTQRKELEGILSNVRKAVPKKATKKAKKVGKTKAPVRKKKAATSKKSAAAAT